MVADVYPAARQEPFRLKQAASLATEGGAAVCNAAPAGPIRPSLSERAAQVVAGNAAPSAEPSCQQSLTMSFFFDGTGNNREADIGSNEHSNVARLYMAHEENDKAQGRYRIYVPGIGTYFKEIGDPGGTTTGMGFGAQGEGRIDWAFKQFQEKLAYHVGLAQNPRNKITMIRVSAFGFSRGATQARAFAREFQKLCKQDGADWRLKAGGHPVRFYFLGLWDTVASVGLPMSANNTPLAQSLDWMSTSRALRNRNMTETGVRILAFGEPGADPAPGVHDGHMDWAHPLDVPSMVERCVHMVAGHELRNSFPVDSCRRGDHYPPGVEEMIYPGVHSDVGGGYRPGEGGRSAKPGQMLSLIPLRAMHQKAVAAGVPLHLLSAMQSIAPALPSYFGADEDSQAEFTKLHSLWQHYMSKAGMGGRPIGQMMNAHMRQYYGWRFYKIGVNEIARKRGEETKDETALKRSEAEWLKEREALEREMAPAKTVMDAAVKRREQARWRLEQARQWEMEGGSKVDPKLEAAAERADAEATELSDPYLKLKARQDTLPGTKGALARNLQLYDQQLLGDAQAIREVHLAHPSRPLRPHYLNLLEAYEAEFIHNTGLRDEQIIEFFDTYVHDSLAAFALDATLPSDPRVVYIGDDMKSRHALNAVPSKQGESIPA